jgi:hypothetical protein
VEFESKKRGRVIVGRIERFNTKTISLKQCQIKDPIFNETCASGWKVAPEYLRPSEKPTKRETSTSATRRRSSWH